ncbi:MAG: carboxypeptidase regulatory-like domain-containing protein [Myxococcales bacterium]|nr:carboxypeptidase regulatory-like domain-containing protein [Myxococcales bacterium]
MKTLSSLAALPMSAGVAALTTIAMAGCGGKTTDSFGTTRQAVTGSDAGTITISGTIVDPDDGPQAGITVTLAGSADAKVVTNFGGSFSFSVAPGGSYSITAQGTPNFFSPPFESCLTLTPSIVNLNNLTQSTNIQIVGSGTDSVLNCTPPSQAGATSGSLTISGKITSGGSPVAGVRVMLNGSTQGFRTTDETGAYSFSVALGSYSIQPSNTCTSFGPSVQT